MLGMWGGFAEIYATVMRASDYLGEFGALAFVAVNVLISGWLFFNLLRLAQDLKRLRLPDHRHLLIAALAFIVTLTFVAPCALVLSLHGGTRDLVVVGMGSCVGIAAALLWRYRGVLTLTRTRGLAQTPGRIEPARSLHAGQALRTALGAPYAPASWRRRSLEFAFVCAVLAGPPLLVMVFGSSMSYRSFSLVLHVSELLSLLAAIALCWVWPLSRALMLFDPKRGALAELALLPGLGDGRQQRRRLYLTTLSVPTAALVGLLIFALSAVWLQGLSNSVYVKLALQFAVFPLFTLAIILGQMVHTRAGWKPWSVAILTVSPLSTFSGLIWNWSSDMLTVKSLRWMSIAVLLLVIVLVGQITYLLRKLALRPHPFVDVSS